MELPFTVDEFFGVFREYNETLWPAQVLLLALALVAILLVLNPRRWSGAGVSAILAFLWVWLAVAYHIAFFARINSLAYTFSALSLAGALLFFWQGVVRQRLTFALTGGGRAGAGAVLIVFALIVYPIWSWYGGHNYPYMPTFGLLAFLVPPYPRSPLIVPVIWCFVGSQAAFLLGVRQDLGLIVAGVVGVALFVGSKESPPSGNSTV